MLEKFINVTVKAATTVTSLLVLTAVSLTAIAVSRAAIKDMTNLNHKPAATKKAAKPKTSGK